MAEPRCWHDLPAKPKRLPGSDEANRMAIAMLYLTSHAPELVDRHIKALRRSGHIRRRWHIDVRPVLKRFIC